MTNEHFVNICQYGTNHGQCSCGPDAMMNRVTCPTPDVCGREYQPKHRKDVPVQRVTTPEQDTHVVMNMDTDFIPRIDDTLPLPMEGD